MATAKSEARIQSSQVIDELFAAVGLERAARGAKKKGAVAPIQPLSKSRDALSKFRGDKFEVLRVADWAKLDWLQHGFSTRMGGTSTVYCPEEKYRPGQKLAELNLGFTAADDAENVAENRRIYLAAVIGRSKPALQTPKMGPRKMERPDQMERPDRPVSPESRLVVLKQIHSSLIHRVENSETLANLAGDGLMTDEPGVMLGILTADCIPILIADRSKRAVAAFHAGWRGTLKRIVEGGVGRMRLEYGSRPEDLMAAIGPGIGCCCYSVGEEVRHEFESQFAYASQLFREISNSDAVKQKYPMLFMTARAPGHGDPDSTGLSLHLDLGEANRRQLLDAGLKPKRIAMLNQCTSCNPERFFSHRRQQGFTGRMMAAIGIRG